MQFIELFISLDQPSRFILSPQNTDELVPVEFVFRSQTPLRLRFYRNYQVVNLDPGTTIDILLKEFDVWSTEDNLAEAGTWTETTVDGDTYYDGTLDLDDTLMIDYFGRSRESYRMAYGNMVLSHGYGLNLIPFTAKIVRTPAY